MRRPILFALPVLAAATLVAPAAGQAPGAGDPAAGAAAAERVNERVNVRVTARIVVVDRSAVARAGLGYVVLGADRVQVVATDRGRREGRGGGASGVRVETHGVDAFLELARERRWIRRESTQQVLTLSGSSAAVASQELAVGGYASRTRGPSLSVVPTVLGDGRVHLAVSARHEDRVRYGWGGGVDGSPARVDTEVIARAGEELVLATSRGVRTAREAGLLRWSSTEDERDVLVAVTVDVPGR